MKIHQEEMMISDEDFFSLLRLKYPNCRSHTYDNQTLILISLDTIRLMEWLVKLEKRIKSYPDSDLVQFMDRRRFQDSWLELNKNLSCLNFHINEDVISYHGIKFFVKARHETSILQSLEQIQKPVIEQKSFDKILIDQLINQFDGDYFLEEKKINSILMNKIKNRYSMLNTLFYQYGVLLTASIDLHIHFHGDANQTSKDQFMCSARNALDSLLREVHQKLNIALVLGKLEDDGQSGLNMNTILICPYMHYKTHNSLFRDLENIVNTYFHEHRISLGNFGEQIDKVAQDSVVGRIDSVLDLNRFFYWVISPYYRYDNFFIYSKHTNANADISVNRIYTKMIDRYGETSKPIHRQPEIGYRNLVNYTTDVNKIFNLKHLDTLLQKKHHYVRIIYREIFSNECGTNALDLPIHIEIFIDTLIHGNEPFFNISSMDNICCVSRAGNQLLHFYHTLVLEPQHIEQIRTFNEKVGGRFNVLINSELWRQLIRNSAKGSREILDWDYLESYNFYYKQSGFRRDIAQTETRLASFGDSPYYSQINPKNIYDLKDLHFFEVRTNATENYLLKLLRQDSVVSRFHFKFAQSFKDKFSRKDLAKYFTEFMRLYKRKPLLKPLKGYFLLWLKDKDQHDYIDAIFIFSSAVFPKFDDLVRELNQEWICFLHRDSIDHTERRGTCVQNPEIMKTVKELRAPYILLESCDKYKRKVIQNNLVPYYTFRHFFLSKDKEVNDKLFTKGTLPKKIVKPKT